MVIMYISSKNKKPLIKIEQKQPEIKNPKNLLFEKMKKMHENVNKLKKEGYLGLTYT